MLIVLRVIAVIVALAVVADMVLLARRHRAKRAASRRHEIIVDLNRRP